MSELRLSAVTPTPVTPPPASARTPQSPGPIQPAKPASIHPPADQLQTEAAGSATPTLSFATLSPATPAQVEAAVNEAINASYAKVPDRAGESRHALNRRLQNQPLEGSNLPQGKGVHYDGSDIVVIAFEGTGAFEPRMAPIMQDAVQRLAEQGLSLPESSPSLHYTTQMALNAKKSQDVNWSGLAAGPLESLLHEPTLDAKTQWLSFPSEEFEALSNPKAFKDVSFRQVLNEAVGSTAGETPGINNALLAMLEIQNQARAQGKNPQFVVISHSSGGRSAVKFLEKAKQIPGLDGQPVKFPVVMTIDPVREAHEAVGEAFKELIYKGTEHNANRVRGWIDALPLIEVAPKKVYPPLVRHRPQPESLYAPSNAEKFLSFYQRKDTEGLKMKPHFGIQGSPVKGAINQEIYDVGSAGHGEITYHPAVTKAFVDQLKSLLK